MLSTFLFGIAVLVASWTAYSALCLYNNYKRAKSLGFPIFVVPVSYKNPFRALFGKPVVKFLERHGFGGYTRFVHMDWVYRQGYEVHEKYGDVIAIVDPGLVQLYIADAAAVDDIAARRKDFPQPGVVYDSIAPLGPNVDSVEGATWQRHRKITTPPFNERNSALVWKESLRQAEEMLSQWIDSTDRKHAVTTTAADTLTVALHVLTGAGFGQPYSFASGTTAIPKGHKMSYRQALIVMLQGFIPMMIFSHEFLLKSWLPKGMQDIGLAVKEFKQYMTEMIDRERWLLEKRAPNDSGNLISSLIRASEDGKAELNSLSDEEIMGNLFIYNLAGHETTANTLAYAILCLSIHPEVQDWLHEEIVSVLRNQKAGIEGWKYEDVFPHLQRCLAAMYETLRLYGPVPELKRHTASSSQVLVINGRDHVIAPDTFVVMNNVAIQTNPKYWGKDAAEWNPKRWIEATDLKTEQDGDGQLSPGNKEQLKAEPSKGCYKPWFDGSPRVCPGKKFSQVEFVAVIVKLLQSYKVRPEPLQTENGVESWEKTKDRVKGVVKDSEQHITLQMRNPSSVGLIWERR